MDRNEKNEGRETREGRALVVLKERDRDGNRDKVNTEQMWMQECESVRGRV